MEYYCTSDVLMAYIYTQAHILAWLDTSVSLRVLLRLLSEGVEVGVAVEEESWELAAGPKALDAEKQRLEGQLLSTTKVGTEPQ